MALGASPPPAVTEDRIETLDNEITQVRAEIQRLTKRRNILSASLLSTSKIQDQLNQPQPNENPESSAFQPNTNSYSTSTDESLNQNLSNLFSLDTIKQHAQSNVHRIGFGVTAFPFTDPNPETSNRPLLGIRFDICRRTGKFTSPYYMLCKRVEEDESDRSTSPNTNHNNSVPPTNPPEMKIHRHTIPSLVPLEEYERRYLPLSQPEMSDSETTSSRQKQNLHALIERVRTDLLSWHQRQDSIEIMREQLDLPRARPLETHADGDGADGNVDGDAEEMDLDADIPDGKFSISSLDAVGVDAYQIRIVWTDGRVGRVKLTSEGEIERVVVIGDQGRMKDVERLLGAERGSVYNLVTRLGELQRRRDEGLMR